LHLAKSLYFVFKLFTLNTKLIFKPELSDQEKEKLIDLRIDLKDSIRTPWLSPVLSSEFNELERIRKSKK
jgi:hypothetical protein